MFSLCKNTKIIFALFVSAFAVGVFGAFLNLEMAKAANETSSIQEISISLSTTEKDSGVAKRELLDAGLKKGVEGALISEFGEESIKKHAQVIQARIMKEVTKFAPSTKLAEFKGNESGHTGTVIVRVNMGDLIRRAQEIGVKRSAEMEPVILPLFTITDFVRGRTYSWWADNLTVANPGLISILQSIESQAGAQFNKKGLQFLKPVGGKMFQSVPEAQRDRRLPWENTVEIAKIFKAPFVLMGNIDLKPSTSRVGNYKVDIKWSGFNVHTKREVAEFVRTFEVENTQSELSFERKIKEVRDSALEDIASQIADARQKGTAETELIQIEFAGLIDPKFHDELKRVVMTKANGTRTMRERYISAYKTIFEIENVMKTKDVAVTLPQIDIGGVIYKQVQWEDGIIRFRDSKQ